MENEMSTEQFFFKFVLRSRTSGKVQFAANAWMCVRAHLFYCIYCLGICLETGFVYMSGEREGAGAKKRSEEVCTGQKNIAKCTYFSELNLIKSFCYYVWENA